MQRSRSDNQPQAAMLHPSFLCGKESAYVALNASNWLNMWHLSDFTNEIKRVMLSSLCSYPKRGFRSLNPSQSVQCQPPESGADVHPPWSPKRTRSCWHLSKRRCRSLSTTIKFLGACATCDMCANNYLWALRMFAEGSVIDGWSHFRWKGLNAMVDRLGMARPGYISHNVWTCLNHSEAVSSEYIPVAIGSKQNGTHHLALGGLCEFHRLECRWDLHLQRGWGLEPEQLWSFGENWLILDILRSKLTDIIFNGWASQSGWTLILKSGNGRNGNCLGPILLTKCTSNP